MWMWQQVKKSAHFSFCSRFTTAETKIETKTRMSADSKISNHLVDIKKNSLIKYEDMEATAGNEKLLSAAAEKC
jgi:hypothetical protein